MTFRGLALPFAAILAGCHQTPSAADNAAADFHFLDDNGGSADELCDSATKATAAYRAERNAAQYHNWKTEARSQCMSADLQRRLRGE